ncbi:MAG TPA: ATP-dependent metallopeptidase FtsH/Yme1/Tma family protein, partial [Polyangiaceae bacterium]|nr:ATP-dependent metallopeptidase FtsH/Yme1/Tma family protein [Polyangiaceae bacterium]
MANSRAPSPGSKPPPEVRSSMPPQVPPERTGGARLWIVLAMILIGWAIYRHYAGEVDQQPPIAYTSFYKAVSDEKVESVTLRGQSVLGKFKAPTEIEGHKLTTFRSMVPEQEDRDLLPLLRDKGVKVDVHSEEQSAVLQLLISVLPLLLIIGAGMWLSRR